MDQLQQTKEALEKNQLPGGRKRKDDIVQMIKNMYMRKRAPKKESKGLIPTKAALFGLDVRFRAVDQAALDEKLRRNAFKKRQARDLSAPSRHSLPMQAQYMKTKSKRDATMLQLQSYATHKKTDRDDGLPIVRFERQKEDQINRRQPESVQQTSENDTTSVEAANR